MSVAGCLGALFAFMPDEDITEILIEHILGRCSDVTGKWTSGGYSVTALTPPAVLEKGTALANSHWICIGNIFNLRFLAKYNCHFSCNLLIKSANIGASCHVMCDFMTI